MTMRAARLAVATLACATALAFAVSTVDARPGKGSSAGNRGSRTEQAIPQTPTAAPRAQQPAAGQPQRPAQPGAATAAAAQPSMARTMMTGFAAGLIGAGLFGLLSGQGFFNGLGGLMGILGLLLQAALIFIVIRLAWGFFARRRAAAMPAPAGVPRQMLNEAPGPQAAAMPNAGAAAAPAQPQRVDAVGIGPDDYSQFNGALVGLMGAYGAEDMNTIRMGVTPEMAQHFEQELADNTRRGVVNRLGQPELLSGDLAESWFEGEVAYATVALHYRMTDVTLNRTTGQVVAGDANRPQEIIEHWTFRRERAGQYWMLSAIAQA